MAWYIMADKSNAHAPEDRTPRKRYNSLKDAKEDAVKLCENHGGVYRILEEVGIASAKAEIQTPF